MRHLTDKKRTNKIITASVAWKAIYERVSLFNEMTGRAEKFQGNEMTQWGNDHEDIALKSFINEVNKAKVSINSRLESVTKEKLVPSKKFLVHKSLPIGATPDAFLKSNPVEVKCPWTRLGEGKGGVYPVIPEKYYYQMQIQMSVTNRPLCWFYVWTPRQTKLELVSYDQSFMDWYMPFAKEFLESVANDTKPKRWSKKPVYNYKEKL